MSKVVRTLRVEAKIDEAIRTAFNGSWSQNARKLLEMGLMHQGNDGVIRHETLIYGERISLIVKSERLAQRLASLMQTDEPIALPSGDYLIVVKL